jgi:nucleolar complex protein 3
VCKNHASLLKEIQFNFHCRSKKETDRLHQLNKPIRKPIIDDLPSLNSDDSDDNPDDDDDLLNLRAEDEDFSGYDSEDGVQQTDGSAGSGNVSDTEEQIDPDDSDVEMPYETKARKRRPSWDGNEDGGAAVRGLPIKLKDGRVQQTGKVYVLPQSEVAENASEDDSAAEDVQEKHVPPPIEDVSTGARFGRPAVVDVIGMKSRKAAILAAKEQIAAICQDIISDPENSVSIPDFSMLGSYNEQKDSFLMSKVRSPSTSTYIFARQSFHAVTSGTCCE